MDGRQAFCRFAEKNGRIAQFEANLRKFGMTLDMTDSM